MTELNDWTDKIVSFSSRTSYSCLPSAVIGQALVHIIDYFSVTMAGAVERSSAILRSTLGTAPGDCTVIGTTMKCSPHLAALYNGFAAHALDFDDTQLSTSPDAVYGLLTHPTTPVLSAALSIGERIHADGRSVVVAYVTGLEVACRIADAIDKSHYQRGFHSTGTIGVFGSAIASAKLLGLTPEQMKVALGIAGSMGAGLRENFGTMTKPFHAGRAAQSGVIASELASQGFTATSNILEAPRGFVHAAAGSLDTEKLACIGNPFFLEKPGVSIKPYPSGSLSHPAQDIILHMMQSYQWTPDSIAKVVVGSNSNVVNALLHNSPQTGLEAKFSIPFCIAVAVLRGRAGLKEFTTETVISSDIQDFMAKVELEVDPELEAGGYQHVRTRVHVHLHSGDIITEEADYAKGYPHNPMSKDDMFLKFRDCTASVMSTLQSKDVFESLWEFVDKPEISDILEQFSIPSVGNGTKGGYQ